MEKFFKAILDSFEVEKFQENISLEKNFADFDEENLGAAILHNLAQNYSHTYEDGVNVITFKLA